MYVYTYKQHTTNSSKHNKANDNTNDNNMILIIITCAKARHRLWGATWCYYYYYYYYYCYYNNNNNYYYYYYYYYIGRLVRDIFRQACNTSPPQGVRSVSEISSCFFGPRPWHVEIRHRVKKTSTINLSGFETLKLKIRRLKLWKPTALPIGGVSPWGPHRDRH